MNTKVCSKCDEDKLVTEYYKNVNQKDGLQPACKNCMNDSYRTSRNKKKDHYNKVCNDRRVGITANIRAWKEERGCCLCEETFGPCLELHHPNPENKDFDPSGAMNKSWAAFLIEAAKCVVLCANCHRKVHHGVVQLENLGFA